MWTAERTNERNRKKIVHNSNSDLGKAECHAAPYIRPICISYNVLCCVILFTHTHMHTYTYAHINGHKPLTPTYRTIYSHSLLFIIIFNNNNSGFYPTRFDRFPSANDWFECTRLRLPSSECAIQVCFQFTCIILKNYSTTISRLDSIESTFCMIILCEKNK